MTTGNDNTIQPKTLADLERDIMQKAAQAEEPEAMPYKEEYVPQPATPQNPTISNYDISEVYKEIVEEPPEDINDIISTIPMPVPETTVTTPIVRNITEKEKKFNDTTNLLSSLHVDLNSIRVRKSSDPLATFEELTNLLIKPTYEVIALQSAYRVSLAPLNNDEIIKIRKISGSVYEQNRKLIAVIFNHVHEASFGKISFESWCKITAEGDWDTLIYGLYCATYPRESDYSVDCPYCNTPHNVKIGKEYLTEVRDEKVFELVSTIINKKLTSEELIKESSVNNRVRIMLPETKIIVELLTPTIHDMLESLLRTSERKDVEPEIFGFLKNVHSIAIPDLAHYRDTGDLVFIELENIEDKLNVMINLPQNDQKMLGEEINKKLSEYEVDYKLPDITCKNTKCAKPIKNIRVDMAEVLFRKLAEV